jgi:hypothetical protein
MQISAANVMASQQSAKPRLASPKEEAHFEPLTFRQPDTASGQPAPSDRAAYVRPGTHVDIRV